MTTTKKETIYIEADDELTTVIEKVLSAKSSIVAVVLPKRATVFQSTVNMKLLKKAATEAKKSVVIISSEPAIESIAAVAGVHLASSLSTKPSIPKKQKPIASETISSKELETSATLSEQDETETETGDDADFETSSNKAKSADDETIELDNTSSDAQELPAGSLADGAKSQKKKRSFKIPDFSSFKLRMGLGILAAVLLIVGWVFGFIILPKATVILNTDTSSSTITFDFIANADVTEADIENGVLPAVRSEVLKEDSVKVPASGEKNIGEKATGSVTFSAQNCSSISAPKNIPAGTGVSSNGKTYITQEEASFGSPTISGGCLNFSGDKVGIVAQDSGTGFNLATGSDFTVTERPDASAVGSAKGGTDVTVKVISAEDVKKATDQLKGTATADAVEELKKKLSEQQVQALAETLEESQPVVKNSPAVGAEAEEVTVTQSVTYNMLGVKSSDLGALLDMRIQETLKDSPDKNVRNNGLDTAVLRLATKTSTTNQTLSLQTIAVLGPEFDEQAIKEEVAGKKRGDIEKTLETRDGVRSVSVEYSPFWITTTPKGANKITIIINEVEN